jgi:hypothetical protein
MCTYACMVAVGIYVHVCACTAYVYVNARMFYECGLCMYACMHVRVCMYVYVYCVCLYVCQ